jgi:arylsulfatase A-like enzyme
LQQNDDRFFVWVHYWDPHDAWIKPPAEIVNRFAVPDQDVDAQRRALYDAEVFYVDSQFGRLVDFLRESGRFDDTIVVVVSDHGEGLGEHDWWYHRLLYQEQIHVPLIVRAPDGDHARVVPDVVRTVDIYPTILDLLGVAEPAAVEGASLLSLMEGKAEPPRVAYADQLNLYDLNSRVINRRPDDDLLYCAMDGSWKLIYKPRNPDSSELYDLTRDPDEARNLYHPTHREVLRLREILDESGGYVDQPFGDGVDEDVIERLRALGYVSRVESRLFHARSIG